ncbi:magnesium transporter [Nostoc sp.]|uniref:magnesium transporter n=1 Tax=Nostoc sp. TaxID=1180 RepID=UPI002FF45189
MLGTIATSNGLFPARTIRNSDRFAIGTSLVAISISASISGSALPFLFRYLRLDAALMSAPFITTAVDVVGILIHFNLAQVI